jgi:peptidoglycan/xylan/chitin deacetylase (PgdA/CDA1 family)
MYRRLVMFAATVLACGGLAASAHAASPLYVSLTFDDGLSSAVDEVLPALQQHGMNATFYINSSTIGSGPAYMTWNDVARLSGAGMEIGGHTLTHTDLVGIWNNPAYTTNDQRTAAVRAQVCPDRQAIISHGIVPTSFAYPNGSWKLDNGSQYGDRTTIPTIIQSCGYVDARTTEGIALEPPDRHCDVCYAPLTDRTTRPFGLRAAQARGSYIAATGEAGNDDLIPAHVLIDRVGYARDSLATNTVGDPAGWLTIVLHDVCAADGVAPCNASQPTADRGHSTTAAALNEFLDWLRSHASSDCIVVADIQTVMTLAQPGTCPAPPGPGPAAGGGGGGGQVGGGSGAPVTPVATPPAPPAETPPAPVTAAPSASAPGPAAPTVRLLKSSTKLLHIGIVGFRAVVSAPAGLQRVEFLVNGKVVGTKTAGPYTFSWSPKRGQARRVRTVKISVRVVDVLGRVADTGDPQTLKVRLAARKGLRPDRASHAR